MYNSVLVTKRINAIMLDGKKGVAQMVVYDAFDIIKEKTGKEPLEAYEEALVMRESSGVDSFYRLTQEVMLLPQPPDAIFTTSDPKAFVEMHALHDMGVRTVMLTGDNERTARAIQRVCGVDEVVAGVLPEGKEREVAHLSGEGAVAMVGDGINDAPALARANVGIAIGAGTDIAIESADMVLMKSDLLDVPAAIQLSRATMRTIKQNLFWAFFYNSVGIPFAAGLFYAFGGPLLSPMLAGAAMALSSISVVSNALRLKRFK